MAIDKSQAEQVEYLRKQKRGDICGGYAELLTLTYNYLKAEVEKSEYEYCNPYNFNICRAVYGNDYHIPMIQGYINKLKSLGYISIKGSGINRKIAINKPLDF